MQQLFILDKDITPRQDEQIRALLYACFPHQEAFLTRRFLRLVPPYRWWMVDQEKDLIVCQVAVHDLIVDTERGEVHVGGVAEVCTHPEYRNRGYAKQLLAAAHEWIKSHTDMEFCVLFGKLEVYGSSGYSRNPGNTLRYRKNGGDNVEEYVERFLVKGMRDSEWPSGLVDLRGPNF